MHRAAISFIFVFATLTSLDACQSRPEFQQAPVIGIITGTDDNYLFELSKNYPRYMQQYGAQVVPVFHQSQDEGYFRWMFNRINGVVAVGGSQSSERSEYAKTVKRFMDMSREAFNTSGELFPILGICLGMQTLVTQSNNQQSVLQATDSQQYFIPLNFTDYGLVNSWFLADASPDVIQEFATENVTANYHHWSVLKSKWDSGVLDNTTKQVFAVVATNNDRQGVTFISLIEGIQYPWLGLQFHPEMYDFYRTGGSQHIAETVLARADSNCHAFDSSAQLSRFTIDNWSHDGRNYQWAAMPDFDFS